MMQKRVAGAASGQSRADAVAQSTKGSGSSRDIEAHCQESKRTARGSTTPWTALSKEELLLLLRRERLDKQRVEHELAGARIARAIAERRATKAKSAADALPGAVAKLKEAQRVVKQTAAQWQRAQLIEAWRSALLAAGLNDFFEGFAKAIDSGKLVLTSIGAARLSEWSRNIRVAPKKHRCSPRRCSTDRT